MRQTRMYIRLMTVVLLMCSTRSLFAQNLSNRGTEFWVGYGHHYYMETGANTQEMVLYFSAEQAATVTVTINNTTYTRTYNVPAYSVIASDLIPKNGAVDARLYTYPCSFVPVGTPCGGEGVFPNHGIRIQSDVPIVAYAHIYGSASSGATMLMPVETWGYSYITLNSKQNYTADCFSWMYIIAIEDNTLVEITPSQTTRTGYHVAGVPFTVTLNKGEIYQTMAGPNSGSTKDEFTGTKVRSIANASGDCYPIAVFSGSSRTYNTPAPCGASSGGDNDNQQCFPEQAWGRRYLTAPTSSSTTPSTFHYNTYKIIVKDPATNVYRNGALLTGMNPAGYYEFNSNQAQLITSDQPIMVAQFIHGGTGCLVTGTGDPEMIYISPIEQGISRVGFYRNTMENITANYLTMIVPTGAVSSVRIDGSPTYDHSYVHPRDPNYTVIIKRWNAANTQAIAECDSAFTAITYGLGSVESYGYNAGTLINNLSGISHLHNSPDPTTPVHPYTCVNTPVEISALIAYEPTEIIWRLSELSAVLTPSADVTMTNPVHNGTEIIDGNTYYKYTLAGTYEFNTEGFHTIKLLCTHPSIDNCRHAEELRIQYEVKGKPTTDFTAVGSGCGLDPVSFSAPAQSLNGLDIVTYNWDFGGGNTGTGQAISHTFTAAGNYPVNLEVISDAGCIADTTIEVNVGNPPASDFTVSELTICEGGTITFTDNSSFNGSTPIDAWYWDFGDGTIITPTNDDPVTHTFTTYGTFDVRYAVSAGSTCVGDTITKTITVRANPIVDMGYPNGCLPADGIVQFTNETTVPDGRSQTIFAWDFGDPSATPGNPNTSNQENPTHTYSSFGTYTISLTVTTEDGCTATLTESPTFNLAPVFSYPALADVCASQAAFSIAYATVTNGVPGNGVYTGPGTSSVGMFDPAVAGPGNHTIEYTYTTTAGCVESVQNTIFVHANPVVDFDIASGTCLPANGEVQFVNNTTIADGQTLTWEWNFDDPNATVGNPNTSTDETPTHNYSDGTYDIQLTATTNNGCVTTQTITKTLSVTPALDYPALSAECASNTVPVSVATAVVTNGVTGSGTYSGPGVTAAGMFDPSVAGAGTHTITYDFTSAAGCAASITQTILVYAAPSVSFNSDANGCLSTTGTVNFTNNTTISDGQTLSWNWNFNDPNAGTGNENTSTAENSTHNFREGTYNISLTATTNNGCTAEAEIPFTFAVTPALDFPAITAQCENVTTPVSIDVATVTNNVNGTGVYSGTGVTGAGMFTPSDAGFGTHTITYEFTSAGGCVASTTSTVEVRAKPVVDFTTSQSGCLDVNGTVNFTNNSSVPDGQTLTYTWNFDDPAAGTGNENTSTEQNPTHRFGEGTFDVQLTVTTNNGCVEERVIPLTFGVTPALQFDALPAFCADDNTPVSIATAQVTNGVTGTGVYSGNGVSADGMFTPTTAGGGTHVITYTFTSAGGCSASITQNVTVNPKPTASFTADIDVCLGETININSNSTIASGTIQTWSWNFGDGTTEDRNNGDAFTYTYVNPGSYNIQLTNVSALGCSSDVSSVTVNVHAIPVTSFTPPPFICMPGGVAEFVNNSSVPDGQTLTYVWNFGDGGTSTGINPTHTYSSTGPFDVILTTTSEFGCASSETQSLTVFYDQPVASFDVTPETVCMGVEQVFTDNSTAPGSTVASWQWTFSDGTTSGQQNPTKVFTTTGDINITLVVTNEFGCASDPVTETVRVNFQPEIDAGPFFEVPVGATVQLQPSANDVNRLSFLWTPQGDIADVTEFSPSFVATQNMVYLLTATADGGCTATDETYVRIQHDLKIPNVFSPNGDGINDTWIIKNISDYPNAVVQVFNRYGQKVFESKGYPQPWDGTYKGSPLPLATYYYVIDLKNGFNALTGSITILK